MAVVARVVVMARDARRFIAERASFGEGKVRDDGIMMTS